MKIMTYGEGVWKQASLYDENRIQAEQADLYAQTKDSLSAVFDTEE